jgi:uncharacterized protein YebE (UPF0316 family)
VGIPWDLVLGGLAICGMRMCDVTMDTIRLILLTRGRKYVAASIGFFQIMIYIVAIGAVLRGPMSWYNIIGYCTGFALGNIIGVTVEERIAMGYSLLRAVVSIDKGPLVAGALRASDFGCTETIGQGKDGGVCIVESVLHRRDVPRAKRVVAGVDDKAFVVVDEARSIFQGYLRSKSRGL